MEKKVKISTDTKISHKKTIFSESITDDYLSNEKNLFNLKDNPFKIKQTSEKKSIINSENKIIYSESKKSLEINNHIIKGDNLMKCFEVLKLVDNSPIKDMQKDRIIKPYDINLLTQDFLNPPEQTKHYNISNINLSKNTENIYVNIEINQFFKKQTKWMKKNKIFKQNIGISKIIFENYKKNFGNLVDSFCEINSLQNFLISEITKESDLLCINHKIIHEKFDFKENEDKSKKKNSEKDSIFTHVQEETEEVLFLSEQNLIQKNQIKSINFEDEARLYTEIISKISETNLEDTIIKLYTHEGYIYHRINWILRQRMELYTNLNLFLIFLIASISSKAEFTSKNFITEKNLFFPTNVPTDNPTEQYLRFYKGSYIDDESINFYLENLSKKSIYEILF